MKIRFGFKIWLYSTFLGLYVSGVLIWVLGKWFQVDHGFGSEPPVARAGILHFHGILSLLFFILFGCLYESHLKKGWLARRKLKSGFFLLLPLLIVMLTVPGLYYLNDGNAKIAVTLIHTYLGLALLLPGLIHPFIKNNSTPI